MNHSMAVGKIDDLFTCNVVVGYRLCAGHELYHLMTAVVQSEGETTAFQLAEHRNGTDDFGSHGQ